MNVLCLSIECFLTDCLLHRTTFHLLPGQLKVNCLCCFCSMFCNVIITFFVLYCDHTGWGIGSSALFVVLHIRLMPAKQHKSSLFPNKIVWSILYSFSYLHTTFVICCAIVSHFHLTVHHYVLFIWGSVSSLHPRYSIPKGQRSTIISFFAHAILVPRKVCFVLLGIMVFH